MELQFEKNSIRCLKTAIHEVKNQEQTQELKLSDAMPDVGRIIGAWGQVILRGKEWRGDSISLSGGVMVWVLYAPEDGSAPRTLDTWIPFQMNWDLPDGTREGEIRIGSLLRFLDARSVSPRRIMIRIGVGILAEALEPHQMDTYCPAEMPDDVALLQNSYPVELEKEAGEKTFLLDEDVILPPTVPAAQKIVCYSIQPRISDQKVMTDKVVFRGSGNLHLLYISEEGKVCCWNFEVGFSQFADLDGSYGTDAQTDILPGVTNLELELDDQGHLRLKCAMVAQYVIRDRQMLALTQDAYSPRRTLEAMTGEWDLPAELDRRSENIYGEQAIPMDAREVVDVTFLPDYPRQRRMENQVQLELPGQFQLLCYDSEGVLQSAGARWESAVAIDAHEDSGIWTDVMTAGNPVATIGNGTVNLKGEICLNHRTFSRSGMPMITGLKLGELREPDPARPSLILRRCRRERLWDIAKETGSTVAAIRTANGLQGEPAENQMLLIPVL